MRQLSLLPSENPQWTILCGFSFETSPVSKQMIAEEPYAKMDRIRRAIFVVVALGLPRNRGQFGWNPDNSAPNKSHPLIFHES